MSEFKIMGLNLGEMLKSALNECMNTNLELLFLFVYFYVLENITVFLFHVIYLRLYRTVALKQNEN